jgi:hypothetical protein
MARQHSYRYCNAAIAYRRPRPKLITVEPSGIVMDATPRPGHSYVWGVTWPPRGRGRGESLTSPRRLYAKERTARAIELRWQGYSWQAIALHLGYRDRSGAWRAVRRATDRLDRNRKD